MAATVVAVVVFLCGVLVGRGVPFVQPLLRTDGGGAATAGLFGDERRPAVINTPNSEPSAAATSGEDLSYFRRLERDAPVEEALRNPRASVDPPPPWPTCPNRRPSPRALPGLPRWCHRDAARWSRCQVRAWTRRPLVRRRPRIRLPR